MMIKGIIIIIILIVGVYFTYLQLEKRNFKASIFMAIASIALSFVSTYLYDSILKPIFEFSDTLSVVSGYDNESNSNKEDRDLYTEMQSSLKEVNKSNIQEMLALDDIIMDVTGKNSFNGNIIEEEQKNKYKYTTSVEGVYRFDTNLSSGGGVRVRISGENNESIDYGNDALTINLEANKTYILSIEYRNGPCDYTVYIGTPVKTTDITGETLFSGNITYQDQNDKYLYTAPVSGTYRFDTNLSSGGEVRLRVSGENGNSINYANNALTIDLEAGKTYILSVEYRNGPCDYTVNIGIPINIINITGKSSFSGSITYQDQKDRYLYTAPVSGTYRFDTNLSSGGEVRLRISGENGNSIKYSDNALTIDLEAGKTYILSTEYKNVFCNYEVYIKCE